MATLTGVFFSLISLLGLFKCKYKRSFRKLVLLAFSLFLILVQILFMNSTLEMGVDIFISLSGLVSGIILILAFQKEEQTS